MDKPALTAPDARPERAFRRAGAGFAGRAAGEAGRGDGSDQVERRTAAGRKEGCRMRDRPLEQDQSLTIWRRTMRKIGISLATLLVVALSACAESPTGTAAGAEASLNGYLGGSGSYVEEGPGGVIGTGHVAAPEEDAMTTTEFERNPGLLGSGH